MHEVVHQMLRPTQLVFSLALRNMHNAYIALLLIYGVCNTQQQILLVTYLWCLQSPDSS